MSEIVKNVLSLDGGGVHVIAQVILLQRILKVYPNFLDKVDIYSGTSAGAILALSLCKYGVDGFKFFTTETIAKMFERNYTLGVLPSVGLMEAKYRNNALNSMLKEEFGTATLQDLPKGIFVPAFKLEVKKTKPKRSKNWQIRYFTNIGNDKKRTCLKDVALRTSAAPTYFPIYQNYCDGGVFANNPASLVATLAKSQEKSVRILSLSGGLPPEFVSTNNGNWGISSWIPYLVDMLLDGNMFVSDLMCQQMLGSGYCRFQLPLRKPIPLDATDKFLELQIAAEQADLTSVLTWISQSGWLTDNNDDHLNSVYDQLLETYQ